MMIFRALVMVLFLGGLALADMSADPALAQETKAGRPAGGQTPAVPPTFDPIAARIKYLHDRLRITPDQEPLWDTVAQVIRNNAQDTTPLLRSGFGPRRAAAHSTFSTRMKRSARPSSIASINLLPRSTHST